MRQGRYDSHDGTAVKSSENGSGPPSKGANVGVHSTTKQVVDHQLQKNRKARQATQAGSQQGK